jgi:hypothetical protein
LVKCELHEIREKQITKFVKNKSIVAIERAIRSSLEASIANAACIHASRECAAQENKRILLLFNFGKM